MHYDCPSKLKYYYPFVFHMMGDGHGATRLWGVSDALCKPVFCVCLYEGLAVDKSILLNHVNCIVCSWADKSTIHL